MRVSTTVAFALSVSAALALLAGCSGGGSQIAPTPGGQVADAGTQSVQRQVVQNDPLNTGIQGPNTSITSGRGRVTTPSFMDLSAVASPLVFVSDQYVGVVDIYPQAGTNQKSVGQITGLNFPQGLATDTAGNLYVANAGSSNVHVFVPPYTKAASLTLADPGASPYGVAVSTLGVVGVANVCSTPSCSVRFYAKNSTTACATVAATNIQYIYSGVFDVKGNLYIVGLGSNSKSIVGEISGGCAAKKITLLTTTNTIIFPTGVQIDKAGRIAILDRGISVGVIDTYNPPINGSLGRPVATTRQSGNAYNFAFLASGADLYVTTPRSGSTDEYDYPGGDSAPENMIISLSGTPVGVAVTPPLVP